MKHLSFCLLLLLVNSIGFCQDSDQEIDASNPTNLYTQINTQFEYSELNKQSKLIGFRGNIQYTFNPKNLLLAEIPVLYNTETEATGLSDIRLRFFSIVKRTMTAEKFNVIAPFIDVTLPSGRYEDGLGKSSMILSGGTVYGFALSKKVLMFPGLSYIYISKPFTNLIADEFKESSMGFLAQSNISISFNTRIFLFINPTYTRTQTAGVWNEQISSEFNLNGMLIPNKLKFNIGYFPNFTNKTSSFRVGTTFYI